MRKTIEENKLLVLLNSKREDSYDTSDFKVFKSSQLDINIEDILEGFDCFLSSDDGLKKLYPVKDLESTLNPDFDDDDYEDPYADIWEDFVLKLLDKQVKYLVVIHD